MSFVEGIDYATQQEFTDQQLGALTAASLMLWLNKETFDVENPPRGHTLHPRIRSSTLMYWKKAISWFHPNRLIPWNELTSVGNPTRSRAVNELIKYVRKQEVRGQGAPSQARRSITGAEFRQVIRILKDESEENNIIWKYGIPAMMNFQYHLISRIDCATQVLCENIKAHDNFDFVLKTKLAWSKNVNEERDAPWQHVMASMDPVYCVHLSLALWLELYAESNPTAPLTPYVFAFSDDTRVPEGGEENKGQSPGDLPFTSI
jgi:hypothetical protein